MQNRGEREERELDGLMEPLCYFFGIEVLGGDLMGRTSAGSDR